MHTADASLRAFNTLRLRATAQFLAMPTSADDARDAIRWANTAGHPITILGGGSNVVLRSRLPGLVIAPRFRGIELVRERDNVRVIAGAGVDWHALVRFCLGQGLGGLENLALIPGSVGAAPIQNIGAYGLELHERFESLTALSCRDATVVTMNAEQCGFGYRDSAFKRAPQEYLIASVTLRLPNDPDIRVGYPDLASEMKRLGVGAHRISVAEAVCRVRRRKLPDPKRVPNAGSFFKNPIVSTDVVERLRSGMPDIPAYRDPNGTKVAAARLIDAAGWKGRRIGRAAVWDRQPLVLINAGDATSHDVLGLAEAIRDDIANRFDVTLELEPSILGADE